jgi:hypothetical protein
MRERRRAERVRLGTVNVRLSGIGGTEIVDLSVLGAMLQVPITQAPDSSVVLEVESSTQILDLRARVVRSTPRPAGAGERATWFVAIEFDDLSMDELVGLSRLIDENRELEEASAETTSVRPPVWS